jgi:hypothetical protein
VQDGRRQVWREAAERRWADPDALNAWLGERCRACWAGTANPEWSSLTVAEVLQDAQERLMPCPKPFDGYVERAVRVSATALVHFQRNRYSVPTRRVDEVLSLRVYPRTLVLVAEGAEVARHARSFERALTFYDWQHHIPLVQTKPGALRSGAPFKAMPEVLQTLQRHLLRNAGGDRVMAQVLAAVPVHGLDAVLVAAELTLEAQRPSAEHVLNVLARLKEGMPIVQALGKPAMPLSEVAGALPACGAGAGTLGRRSADAAAAHDATRRSNWSTHWRRRRPQARPDRSRIGCIGWCSTNSATCRSARLAARCCSTCRASCTSTPAW